MSFKKLPPELWDIARQIWKKHKDRGLITDEWCALFMKAGVLDVWMEEARMDATRAIIQGLSHEARREGRLGSQIANVRTKDVQGKLAYKYAEYQDLTLSELRSFAEAEFRKIGSQRRKAAEIYQFAENKFGRAFTEGLLFGPADLPEINEDLGTEDEPEE